MTNEAPPPANDGKQPAVYPPPPAVQQPPYQGPGYQQQPVYQQPSYQQPVYQQPVYQQPGYQNPYAVQPAPYAAPQPTNVLAVITLVLALLGVSIGAVITGHISLGQVRRTGEQGHGIALAGLIIGYAGCLLWVVVWIFMLALPALWIAMFAAVGSGTSA